MGENRKVATDANAPLDDPWFEDSQPIEMPEQKPAETPRTRKDRTTIHPLPKGGAT